VISTTAVQTSAAEGWRPAAGAEVYVNSAFIDDNRPSSAASAAAAVARYDNTNDSTLDEDFVELY